VLTERNKKPLVRAFEIGDRVRSRSHETWGKRAQTVEKWNRLGTPIPELFYLSRQGDLAAEQLQDIRDPNPCPI